jgi:hypothetical protein
VSIHVLSWSLYAWIINLNFPYASNVLECLISFTNLKLKIRTSRETFSMMINSNTRFFSRSFISLRLEFSNVRVKIEMRTSSNWFECEFSSWRKTMISAKFWYRNDERLAWVDLMIAGELVISNESVIVNELVISKNSTDKLFRWSNDWTFSISELN